MILERRIPAADRPVRLSPGQALDSYGDASESWATPVSSPLPRGSQVQDRGSTEATPAGKHVTTLDRVLFIPGTHPALTAASRVLHRGQTYRVEGKPHVLPSLMGAVYTSALLVRHEGA